MSAFPALIAALLFRGGLVLLIAGVTFVRKDGSAGLAAARVLARAGGVESADSGAGFVCDSETVARRVWRGFGRLFARLRTGNSLPGFAEPQPAGPPGRHLAGAALMALRSGWPLRCTVLK